MKLLLSFCAVATTFLVSSEPIISSVNIPDPLPTVIIEQHERAMQTRGHMFMNMSHAVTIGSAHKQIGGIKKLDAIIQSRIDQVIKAQKKKGMAFQYSSLYDSAHGAHFSQQFLYERVLALATHEAKIIRGLFGASGNDGALHEHISDQQLVQVRDVLSDLFNRWYQTANDSEHSFLQMLYAYTLDPQFIEKKSRALIKKLILKWSNESIKVHAIHTKHANCCCSVL